MPARPFWFEDHEQGERIECASHLVTADEGIGFASQWDPQPWHVDAEAAKSSLFAWIQPAQLLPSW